MIFPCGVACFDISRGTLVARSEFMLITDLTIDECRAVLRGTNLGRLACVKYDQPYVVPIYFDFYEDYLYSFATLGKKIQWMRSNPRVCVEVDHILDQFNWTTVVAEGRYEELTRTPAHEAARKRAFSLFQNRPDWWFPAGGRTRRSPDRVPVIYRIEIESLSGREAARNRTTLARTRFESAARAPQWWSHVLRPLQGPDQD
jgi:nitroimidazol reductase NimA-like FMN-containing flavoprotein (pyridoxamine 5'-phosphate oxidase superfamily)